MVTVNAAYFRNFNAEQKIGRKLVSFTRAIEFLKKKRTLVGLMKEHP
jgi:hypothetical protein